MPEKNPGAGHESKPVPVSWTKRDVLLFAVSVGATANELHFLYENNEKFATFPTYPIILPFKGTSEEVVDFYKAQEASRPNIPGIPELDPRGVLDGERRMIFFKPVPTSSDGRRFESRGKVIGVYDKGKAGTVMETQTDLVDADSGETYTRVIGSAFYPGKGNWGGPKGPKAENFPPPKDKKPDAVYEFATTGESALLYRLNGDYNPLHATPEPGKAMGFGGIIIHGLFSWNTTAYALVKTLGGGDPQSIGEFAARFTAPVKPNDVLVTEIWRTGSVDNDGWEDIRFVTKIKNGKVCLNNGRARMKVAEKSPKSKL